jgi:hypothetical protein
MTSKQRFLISKPVAPVSVENQDTKDKLLPHERDEKTDPAAPPRKKMQQAHTDLENGLVDTDMHGQRGIEVVVKKNKRRA